MRKLNSILEEIIWNQKSRVLLMAEIYRRYGNSVQDPKEVV